MPDRVASLYERTAGAWARGRQRSGLEEIWLEQFRIGLPEGGSVLDLGCGHGVPIGERLIAQGHAVTGVDSAPSLIAMAADRFPQALWIVGDMRELALDRAFDGLIAWHSLFHLTADDQRAMFPRFAAHARPGTMLLFTTGPEAGVRYGEWEGEPLFHASLGPDEYARLLDASGFLVLAHQVDDAATGGATVWLARLAAF